MEFNEVLENRKSIRKFKPTDVPEQTVREILQLAQLAPSAGNVQAYKVKIVRAQEDKNKLKEATMSKQESIATAPVVLAICADKKESGEKYGEKGENFYSIQDATIFASYVQLAIASEGLSCVWVGAFIEDEVKKVLALPENLKLVALIPLGHADGEPRVRERKNLEDILLK
jgi:nitroreductase